MKTDYNI